MSDNKTITCVVTNDLTHDQRMHRICYTLQNAGYEVLLLGRKRKKSNNLTNQIFSQKRLKCFFEKGALFYLEYNLRVFFYLLFNAPDIIYSVDTDTLLACTFTKIFRSKKLFYDSHEYFTELPELDKRPVIKGIWRAIEKTCIPFSHTNITVNQSIADILSSDYNRKFTPIFNYPKAKKNDNVTKANPPILLYQGVLNEGRGLEEIIGAMEWITEARLIIAGDGYMMETLRQMVEKSPAQDRIELLGWVSPNQLSELTSTAYLGLNLLDGSSLNYYYSLANKFFDYIQADVPSLNMDFPEYRRIDDEYDLCYLVDTMNPRILADKINDILSDKTTYNQKVTHCNEAAKILTWESQEKALIDLVASIQ